MWSPPRWSRHLHQEFLRFLKLIGTAVPQDLELHLVLDNYATHKTPEIHEWLLRHPRFHLHFIPASSWWLNLVERWFADLTSRKLRRSAHRSVTEFENGIRKRINDWNKDPKPFAWVKTADEIRNPRRLRRADHRVRTLAAPGSKRLAHLPICASPVLRSRVSLATRFRW